MPELSLSRLLLTMFTTPDRAEAIEGDLLEQSGNSHISHAWQLMWVLPALAWQRLIRELPQCLLCAYAAYELLAKWFLWVALPSTRYLQYRVGLEPWLVFLYSRSVWISAALLTGYLLPRYLPGNGILIVLGTSGCILGRVLLTGEVSLPPLFGWLLLPLWLATFAGHYHNLKTSPERLGTS